MVENEGPAEVCVVIGSTTESIEVVISPVMKGVDNPAAG